MFWSKHPLFYSLKTRTAVLYGSLFTLSFLIIFGIVYLYLYLGNQESVDRRLKGILSECEYEYLTGTELPLSLLPVRRIEKIPSRFFQQTAGETESFQLLLAFHDVDGKFLYLLFLHPDRRTLKYLTIDMETGRVEKKETSRPPRTDVLAQKFARESFGEGNRIYLLLLDKDGRLLAKSPFSRGDLTGLLRYPYRRESTDIQYANLRGSRWRIRMAYRTIPNGTLLVIGLNQHAADENLQKISYAFLITGLTVLALSILCGWFLACRIVSGIERVGRTADRIADGDYSLRISPNAGDLETDDLIASFNTMTANTETLMSELKTITDDIAHDLRTPLTRMLGRSEIAVTLHPTSEKLQDTLGDNAEDCRRMLALINQMLAISKTESGASRLHRETVDLKKLLERASELFRMPAEQKRQTLLLELPAEPVFLSADPARLQQLIANLVDNALKFTSENGSIVIRLTESAEEILLSVSDTGCGIPPEECKKVFKRFYRADTSRNLPGNGLGLAMVRAIATAHGGFVSLSSEVGKGSTFTVHFPKRNGN